jgi:hypothetical protein
MVESPRAAGSARTTRTLPFGASTERTLSSTPSRRVAALVAACFWCHGVGSACVASASIFVGATRRTAPKVFLPPRNPRIPPTSRRKLEA